ncbi:hypothetical protein KSP40_PGU021035 [Platanthera guangdongensis]|uniref:Uncharacterized protein n=1 Tax=Platanthera guangdongensis TaxID=2320717 RepID=A0ABR2LZT7_9ASPA
MAVSMAACRFAAMKHTDTPSLRGKGRVEVCLNLCNASVHAPLPQPLPRFAIFLWIAVVDREREANPTRVF